MTATQCSTLPPLPLPIRVSAGLTVEMGLSGKIRIHSLPPRLTVTGDGDAGGFDLARS